MLITAGESGITVEAFGPGDVEGCSVSQEEAKTDAGGAFRIRGLIPGCNYKVGIRRIYRFCFYLLSIDLSVTCGQYAGCNCKLIILASDSR